MGRKSRDAVHVLKEMAEGEPRFEEYLREARVNAVIAQMIYDARKEAGLTQKELANLIGTTQSVISQLEDADYDGHSLTMLQRIGAALKKRIEIRFVPLNANDSKEVLINTF